MAKVHKAHKSGKKYSFQKKKLNVKTLLIVLAVVIVAAIGLKIAYDGYVSGEFDVAAPTNERLDYIADNWAILNTHTDDFMNYYTLYGLSEDGTDGNGNVVLYYFGNDTADTVLLQIDTTEPEATDVQTAGVFARTSLTNFINGVASWGTTQMEIDVANAKLGMSIYVADAAELDDALLDEILTELEAIIAEGPVVDETAEDETEAEPETEGDTETEGEAETETEPETETDAPETADDADTTDTTEAAE